MISGNTARWTTTANNSYAYHTRYLDNDFIWNKNTHPEWYGRWFYKDILGVDGHNGIDMEAPSGTWLYAPHDGKIIPNYLHMDGKGIRLQGK
jgi:murein DD-endopeptidase MepM/ murein hydrolase activator NlpD